MIHRVAVLKRGSGAALYLRIETCLIQTWLQGLATNFSMLLAAVMVGSVGASVHLTLPISLVSDLLPPQHATYDSPTTL